MNISPILKQLSILFKQQNANLYIVGGAVRNYVIGVNKSTNIDICSQIEVRSLHFIKNHNFKYQIINSNTGTAIISCGGETFEYTTFRKENYIDFKHNPIETYFVKTLEEDVLRRDFTCNSLYYDIIENKIIDPLSAVSDIENKIMKTVLDPNITLSNDALRILRAVRLSAELGFKIDDSVYEVMKQNAYQIKQISWERINIEFRQILTADTKYPILHKNKCPHFDAMVMLDDLKVLDYILPELLQGKNIEQNQKYHSFDVFTHILLTFKFSAPKIRMVMLMHDIAKPYCYENYGNVVKHAEVGQIMATEIMRRLKYSKTEIDYVKKMIELHIFDIDGETSIDKCKIFIIKNYKYFADLCLVRIADTLGKGKTKITQTVKKWQAIEKDLINSKAPFSLNDLAIDGNDVKEMLEVENNEIGNYLNKIWDFTIINPNRNNKVTLLAYLKNIKNKINK